MRTYPVSIGIVVSVLHDELELLVDLVVLGLGAGGQVALQFGVRIAAKVVITGTPPGTTFVVLLIEGLEKSDEN